MAVKRRKKMITLQPKKDKVVRGQIDVTKVARGHLTLPRGGVHGRRPARSNTKVKLRNEFST